MVSLSSMQVDLGGGFMLDIAIWNKIQASAKSPAMVCKEVAANLWTPQDLCIRSVTGKQCNANSAKGVAQKVPLTPGKYVAVKSKFFIVFA